MRGIIGKIKEIFGKKTKKETYIELVPREIKEIGQKMDLYVYTLEKYDDIRSITARIRENAIILIDIRPLMVKDKEELRRAIEKIKMIEEAHGGKVIGIAEGFVVAAPEYVEIKRGIPE